MRTYVYFVRGAQHAALARTSIESVRKADPAAQVLVMTDEAARTWDLSAAIGVIPSGLPIMLANLEAQVRALVTAPIGSELVFLDTDILVLEPLPIPFEADVVVTWRDHVGTNARGEKVEGVARAMPYNYGVLGARQGYAAIEAFFWLRERVRQMHTVYQDWYGNQLALAQLAGPPPAAATPDGRPIERRPLRWTYTAWGNEVRIAKLPGERWNYTPQQVGEQIHGKRGILHFKGGKRALMESYAKRLGLGWYTESDVRKEAA